jgi:hypothetical protein
MRKTLLTAAAIAMVLVAGIVPGTSQRAQAQLPCANCSYPDYNCILVYGTGYLNCQYNGGQPCIMSGPCSPSAPVALNDVVPDGTVRSGIAMRTRARAAAAQRAAYAPVSLIGAVHGVARSGGSLFEKTCGGIVVGRTYSAEAAARKRQQSSVIVL